MIILFNSNKNIKDINNTPFNEFILFKHLKYVYYNYKKFKKYFIECIYFRNKLRIIEYLKYSGELHREDGPAFTEYHENDKICKKSYWLNGKVHRKDDPARIGYFKNGEIEYKLYYLNGEIHREYGPAWINYSYSGKIENKQYYLNNKEYSYKEYLNELKIMNNTKQLTNNFLIFLYFILIIINIL